MRDDLDGCMVVNANFILLNFFEILELRVSLYNNFDEEYAYPASPFAVVNDYLAPGRSIFLEARYIF